MFKKLNCIFAVFIMVACFTGCSTVPPPEEDSTRTKVLYNTAITVSIDQKSNLILDGAFSFLSYYEELFNVKSKTSLVSRINDASVFTQADAAFIELLNYSREIYELSNKTLDITAGTLVDIWCKPAVDIVPTDEQIMNALEKVGFDNITIEGDTVLVHNGAKLDFSALGKGFIADKLSAYLIENGVNYYLIDVGGNINIQSEDEYLYDVFAHFGENRKSLGKLSITSGAIYTASIYAKYFEKDGELYHHLIDLTTGLPVKNSIVSVTVIAPNGKYADALSTACLLMGYEDGAALIESSDDVEAIFTFKDGTVRYSSGIGGKVKFISGEAVG